MNELYHHGIKGMKWGVRRYQNKDGSLISKEKLHLGLDKHGNISLIRGKTTKEAKKAFAVRSSLFIASMGITAYIATHPDTFDKGQKTVENFLKKKGSLNVKTVIDSGIYSESLGRMMTIAEAMDAGFDLSDK